jgi:hypothetical protein
MCPRRAPDVPQTCPRRAQLVPQTFPKLGLSLVAAVADSMKAQYLHAEIARPLSSRRLDAGWIIGWFFSHAYLIVRVNMFGSGSDKMRRLAWNRETGGREGEKERLICINL